METAWIFVFINVWIVSCQETDSSSDDARKPELIPGEELLNTFLQTENNDTSDVPKDLEILKGWIYEDNSPDKNKGEKEELKVRNKRHLLKCKILGHCGGSGGGGYSGGGGGGGELLINIGLPTINIGFPAPSQSCNTCPQPQPQPQADPCQYGGCYVPAPPPNPCSYGKCPQRAPQYSPPNPCDYGICDQYELPPPPSPPMKPIPSPVPYYPQPDSCPDGNCAPYLPPPPPPQKHGHCGYGPCPQPTPPPRPPPDPCASEGCVDVKPIPCPTCGTSHVIYSHAEATSYSYSG